MRFLPADFLDPILPSAHREPGIANFALNGVRGYIVDDHTWQNRVRALITVEFMETTGGHGLIVVSPVVQAVQRAARTRTDPPAAEAAPARRSRARSGARTAEAPPVETVADHQTLAVVDLRLPANTLLMRLQGQKSVFIHRHRNGSLRTAKAVEDGTIHIHVNAKPPNMLGNRFHEMTIRTRFAYIRSMVYHHQETPGDTTIVQNTTVIIRGTNVWVTAELEVTQREQLDFLQAILTEADVEMAFGIVDHDAAARDFARMLERLRNERAGGAERELSFAISAAENHMATQLQLRRDIMAHEATLAVLNAERERLVARHADLHAEISALPGVGQISLSQGVLKIAFETGTLARADGSETELGPFSIVINLQAGRVGWTFTGIRNQHPNLHRNRPVLGPLYDALPELMAEGDIAGVVRGAYAFATTAM